MTEADPPAGDDGQSAAEFSTAAAAGDAHSPAAAGGDVVRTPLPIRRVPRPSMTGPLDSPVRNLVMGVSFTIAVMILATAGYMSVGWSFRDALYMVIITVFTVGYDEVRPIDTPQLSAITITLIVLGCTSIIFLTGALVQYFTVNQLNQLTGKKRMEA